MRWRTFIEKSDRSRVFAPHVAQYVSRTISPIAKLVAIPIARRPQETINGVRKRAGHLFHPTAAGLGVDAGEVYTTRLQLNHEEDEVTLETGKREHFDGKEVGSREAGPMCLQERLPRRALTPLGGRGDPVVV